MSWETLLESIFKFLPAACSSMFKSCSTMDFSILLSRSKKKFRKNVKCSDDERADALSYALHERRMFLDMKIVEDANRVRWTENIWMRKELSIFSVTSSNLSLLIFPSILATTVFLEKILKSNWKKKSSSEKRKLTSY